MKNENLKLGLLAASILVVILIVGGLGGFLYQKYVPNNLSAATVVSVSRGGTGWGNIESNTLLTGNGTGKLATTTIGSGLTLSGGNLTADAGATVFFGDIGNTATSSDATGDVYYLNASGQLVNLGIGSAGEVLEVSAGGIPEWDTDDSGAGSAFAWTPSALGNSTSTTLFMTQGFVSNASSTIQELNVTNIGTTTNAISTNSTSTIAAITSHLDLGGTLNLAGSTIADFVSDATISLVSNALRVVDVVCTDCLNATEIEDIYVLNTGDTVDGDLFIANGNGLTVGHSAQITTNQTHELQVLGTTGADAGATIGRFSSNSQGAHLDFVKSRNATIGSNTIVNDNDVIGLVQYYPDDGVDFATLAGRFKVEVDDASPAAGDIGTALVWDAMPGGGGAIQEQWRIAADGSMSLGTAGVTFSQDGDGALTITGNGNGTDENLVLNFDDTSNEIDVTSGTGVTVIDFNTIGLNTDSLVLGADTVTDITGTGLSVSGGSLNVDLGTDISAAEIADGDHGDFTYTSGSASLDANVVQDNEIDYSAVTLADFTDDIGAIFGWTPSALGNSTSTALFFTQGFVSNASSTIQELNVTNIGTTTNAIMTNATSSIAAITSHLDLGGTLNIGGDTINEFAGDGLTVTGNALTADLGTAIVTGEITDGTIIEPDLDADVAAADGDYLQYDSTGTNFTWRNATELVSDIEAAMEAALDTLTALTDVIVSTALEIPNGASPTVNAAGEIALDTTDNQLLVADSGNTARVFGRAEQTLFSFVLASTSPDFNSSGIIDIPKNTKDGRDITQFRCHVDGGTSVVVNVSDGTNDTETITCATTQTSDTDVATNSTFTADELWEVQIGTITGTPDYLIFEAYGYITRE